MSLHPVNLVFRFLLELAGLFALGYWGWVEHEGIGQPILGFGVPLVAAIIWGVFHVRGETKDGPVRLLLEVIYFGAAVGLLAAADQPTTALILGGLVSFHYALSYDRLRRLLPPR